jgi:TolB protein
MSMRLRHAGLLALPLIGALGVAARAEWTNRYPKVAGVSHHVYLEGFNLPTFSQGPTDPAPSPDSRTIAFAARGWLWEMDVASREARRITRAGGVDARPAWSPDGRSLVFVRDDGRDLAILLLDRASGRTRVLVDSPAMDMDPAFTPDGRSVLYSSAEAGDFDLWRVDVASGARTRLTTEKGQELNPVPVQGGDGVAYVAKVSAYSDTVALLSLKDGARRTLRSEGLASQLRLTASPDGRSLVATVPDGDRWRLVAFDVAGGDSIRIASDAAYPLFPAWASNGDIWFVQPMPDERFGLFRAAVTGGAVEDRSPIAWHLGERSARVTIRTRRADAALPARLAVADGQGHPVAPAAGITYFDGQHGRHFFHSPGAVTLEVPAGAVTIRATHGWDGEAEIRRTVRAGEEAVIDLDLPTTGFDAHARGYRSADLHTHLNYGGPFQLEPEDLVPMMRAEGLDVATPQLANLQTTLVDRRWAGWRRTEPPLIRFSQEVRSHFLGHVAVIGADALFTPWFFGPGYPVYAQSEVANYDALRFARAHGGLGIYVHPVSVREPFPVGGEPAGLPLELVPDAILGDVDAIELACLWSDELGTTDAWYRLLNLGLPIAPSGGSDTMHNFHRTMAIGATRVYARPEGAGGMDAYLDAVRKGRSFVSTGPLIDFKVAGRAPGEVVGEGARSVEWTLDAASPVPVQSVEIVVNGRVAWRGDSLKPGAVRRYAGRIDVPAGGWVAARVHGGASAWPIQDSYPFAHSAPVWLGRVGSTEPAAQRAAAADLSRWMDVAERRLATGYPGAAGARVKARFAEARARLRTISGQ